MFCAPSLYKTSLFGFIKACINRKPLLFGPQMDKHLRKETCFESFFTCSLVPLGLDQQQRKDDDTNGYADRHSLLTVAQSHPVKQYAG